MNNSSRRWKVFVIVLCMLFTMTPGMVFADEPADQPIVEQPLNNPADPSNTETSPDDVVSGDGIKVGDGDSPLDENAQMNVELSWGKKYGTLTVIKNVIDKPESIANETFEFVIEERHGSGTFWSPYWYDPETTVSIVGADSEQIRLETGDYRIIEQVSDDYSIAESERVQIVDIRHNRNTNVTFNNTYNGPTTGSLKITKDVSSEFRTAETVFNFTVTGPDDYDERVSVTAGAFVTLEDLMPGEYTITEDYTEDFYPEDNIYNKTGSVEAGAVTIVEFINYYDPEEPTFTITKEVAPYTIGEAIPATGFEKSLTLTKLNQSVIYRISYSFNEAWGRNYRYVSLADIYDRNGTTLNITDDLKVWNDSELVTPGAFDPGVAYYYIDTLPSYGTYTNTAYLYEPKLQYSTLANEGDGELAQGIIASSSAVVVVNYSSGGGGGGGSSRTNYYEVTYNANLPAGADLSGAVPTDSKNYTYNTTVSVKGNSEGLKAGNYTFEGWNTKADGTGTMYLPGNTFNIKEDTILYAQWKLASEPAAAEPNVVITETAALDDVPKTGDTAPLIPMLLLGLLSLSAITLGRKKILD